MKQEQEKRHLMSYDEIENLMKSNDQSENELSAGTLLAHLLTPLMIIWYNDHNDEDAPRFRALEIRELYTLKNKKTNDGEIMVNMDILVQKSGEDYHHGVDSLPHCAFFNLYKNGGFIEPDFVWCEDDDEEMVFDGFVDIKDIINS